jgi:hypothetical protein
MKALILLGIITFPSLILSRSIYRSEQLPKITTCWKGDAHCYTICNAHLEEYPFFCLFDKARLQQYNLPNDRITYRNQPEQTVLGSTLKRLINELLVEIQQKKTTFTHFTVLQQKDYNWKKSYGFLVLKFKKYPFVLKLFIETPESITRPFDKGIEPVFFFFMGGGVNRHLIGFTRIPNRNLVAEKIKQSEYWSERIDVPRKWIWVPPAPQWITIKGEHIGTQPHQEITIPGTYCIIADAIHSDRALSIARMYDRTFALDLCNYLSARIDPHINNFLIEKDTQKLVIIDTEHFPTLVGLDKERTFRSYVQWYFHLINKCVCNMFFRTKRKRKQMQYANGREKFYLFLPYNCRC